MRIHFERTGGFAGMRVAATIDTATLAPEEAQKLQEQVAAAKFFHLPASIPAQTGADSFHYQVTIEDQGQRHTLVVGESAASPELKALLRDLTRIARQIK